MVIVEINGVKYGSTGHIMLDIAEAGRASNLEVYTACPDSRLNRKIHLEKHIVIGNIVTNKINRALAQITGLQDCFSLLSTRRFINRMKKKHVDIVHLHNLHGSFLNLRLLFKYIKKNDIKVIWTLHDCWAFTAKCPYFDMVQCSKWKTGCYACQQYKEYPKSNIDQTKRLWRLKKKSFTSVTNLAIVTPSEWLADLVKQSFLKKYPVRVINNGIDLNTFKPTESTFREQVLNGARYLILAVAFGWETRKGIDVIIELAKRLPKAYRMVIVGADNSEKETLPDNIVVIPRTFSQSELAVIYSAADVFVNPTREDNFPTVNMESIACGTPVITFETGGSPESIGELSGRVVRKDDVDELIESIKELCHCPADIVSENCIQRAMKYNKQDKAQEYVALYLKRRNA